MRYSGEAERGGVSPGRTAVRGSLFIAAAGIACAYCLALKLTGSGNATELTEDEFVLGYQVYSSVCSNCHGGRLQGQWAWRSKAPESTSIAPPLDNTGATWLRSDRSFLQRIRQEDEGSIPNHPEIAPGLTAEEAVAVLSFVKTHWSWSERTIQSVISGNVTSIQSPWHKIEWRFPPDCFTRAPPASVTPSVPSWHLLREVLPLGTHPSTKDR